MERSATGEALRRRPGVLAAVLLLTAIALVAVYTLVAPTYSASGSLLLSPPPLTAAQAAQLGDYAGQNPVLSFSDSLYVVANVTVSSVSADQALSRIKSLHGLRTVSLGVSSASPSILVTTTAASAAGAIAGTVAVMGAVAANVADRQASLGAPAGSYVRTTVLTAPTTAATRSTTRTKALVATGVTGVVVAVLAAWSAEAVADRRRRRLLAAPLPVRSLPLPDPPALGGVASIAVTSAGRDELPADRGAAAQGPQPLR